ncbi:hypothetical protein ES705_08614 [subsurface metagenome]
MSYKSVWDFGRAGKANYSVHGIGEYPSKIRPMVFAKVVERFSKPGDIILDPFCGCGTLPVEAKIQGRSSVSYDINPYAVELTKKKLNKLNKDETIRLTQDFITDCQEELTNTNGVRKFKKIQIEKEINKLQKRLNDLDNPTSIYYETTHIVKAHDARDQDLPKESVNAVMTDIPYANMIQYSSCPGDLSLIVDYSAFLEELEKALKNAEASLKKEGYFVIFCADYRIGASRKILPVHVDVINIMRGFGLTLFDTYIWRYYRSGSFRPFGKHPYQAMNVHIYILVFYKSEGEQLNKANRSVRYRPRLKQKIEKSSNLNNFKNSI